MRKRLAKLVGCAGVLWFAEWSLARVGKGVLFWFPMPWDAPASLDEIVDGRELVQNWHPWAMALIAGVLLYFMLLPEVRRTRLKSRLSSGWTELFCKHRILLSLFAIATLLDMATTLHFFLSEAVHYETHPGIRLVTYAYGRTTGPVLSKLLQASIALYFCSLFSFKRLFLSIVSLSYLFGACFNHFLA